MKRTIYNAQNILLLIILSIILFIVVNITLVSFNQILLFITGFNLFEIDLSPTISIYFIILTTLIWGGAYYLFKTNVSNKIKDIEIKEENYE